MFQTYDDIGGPAHVSARLKQLRAAMKAQGIDGFIVPSVDEYGSEYTPPHAQRLLWLTGFSGSWGVAVALAEKAALFVDGRYTLQARTQTDAAAFAILKYPEAKPSSWLAEHARAGARIGFDPRLHSMKDAKALEDALAAAGASLAPLQSNPIDALWTDRPAARRAPASLHDERRAGRSAADKLGEIRYAMRKSDEHAALVTSPESVAWLLNIRGADVAHVPVALCEAIVHAAGPAELFIDEERLGAAERKALSDVAVIRRPAALEERLSALAGRKVRIDVERTPAWHAEKLRLAGAALSEGQDPCLLPRARKTPMEIDGARSAHARDGAAMAAFLAWLDKAASGGGVDEIAAAQKLEAFRRRTGALREISFDTISGAGPNGAIVHYRVTRATNRALSPGSLYLVDSGAQYEDGTTDVTRTVAVGEPTPDMRRHFTLVLKGHIAIAAARFPPGTRGVDLDPLARRALWAAGLDYDHGTGHGVGSYLSVHEGPQGISRRSMTALEPGMIVSNEPGYYREGAYGIRIENLLLVTPPAPIEGGERDMLGFETLTLAPIDRRLVETGLLDDAEIDWLNAYHDRVLREIGPALNRSSLAWLKRAAAPIRRPASKRSSRPRSGS